MKTNVSKFELSGTYSGVG
ncbi:Protein of unknown function [Bacillus wiedmannii]|nr:Protein of unknown function [Bacillus wiedmannii]